jgi:hypothetical protein
VWHRNELFDAITLWGAGIDGVQQLKIVVPLHELGLRRRLVKRPAFR